MSEITHAHKFLLESGQFLRRFWVSPGKALLQYLSEYLRQSSQTLPGS